MARKYRKGIDLEALPHEIRGEALTFDNYSPKLGRRRIVEGNAPSCIGGINCCRQRREQVVGIATRNAWS
jgi:hypothetical protein